MKTSRLLFLLIVLCCLCSARLVTGGTSVAAGSSTYIDSVGVVQGNDDSYSPSISNDGRYVAFESYARNLVSIDKNNVPDIFVHDRQTGQTIRVSVSSSGLESNSYSNNPVISMNGRFIAFESNASNLVPSDTNNYTDVFVYDQQTRQTTRVSVSSVGAQGNGGSQTPTISGDGRLIAFVSSSDNLVPGDSNKAQDIFVHNRQTQETLRVSVSNTGIEGNLHSLYPVIASDGRTVAFTSSASNLVPSDTNDREDVFVYDLQTRQIVRVSISSFGVQANGASLSPFISRDGRFVAFHSTASNLVPEDTNDKTDTFVHDRQTGQTTRVSVTATGIESNGDSGTGGISDDGHFVAFSSSASNLIPGDVNNGLGGHDMLMHDRQTGQLELVSVSSEGVQGVGRTNGLAISTDGRFAVFHSEASNLVPHDTQGHSDVFVRDRQTGETTRVSVPSFTPQPTLSVSHIEVTQVIQDENNDVPLIADKPTFVRVYVRCTSGCETSVFSGVRGRLTVTRLIPGHAEELLGVLDSFNSINVLPDFDWVSQRGNPAKTLNFNLPISELQNWVSIPDSNAINAYLNLTAEVQGDAFTQTVQIHRAKPLKVIYVPVQYMGQTPDLERIKNNAVWLEHMLPTFDLIYELGGEGNLFPWNNCQLNTELCSEELLIALNQTYRTDASHKDVLVFGWLPNGTYLNNNNGISNQISGVVAWGSDHPTAGPRIFAHEIGHLLGRRHTNSKDNTNYPWKPGGDISDPGCKLLPGNDPNIDDLSDWPYSYDVYDIRASSRIQQYGLEGWKFSWLISSPLAVLEPSVTFDYMSYCGSLTAHNIWTSDFTYTRLFDQRFRVTDSGGLALAASGLQTYAMVSGLIFVDNLARIDPIWLQESDTPPHNDLTGTEYCVEVQDAASVSLSQHCFDLNFLGHENNQPTNVKGFRIAVPYPTNSKQIVLKHGNSILAVTLASDNPPEVTLISPNGGENWGANEAHTVSWAGSDLDNQSLTYRLFYSGDGANWKPVGNATTSTSVTVESVWLTGGNNSRFKVTASDGINTSSDESDTSFTVARKVPQVFISAPEAEQGAEPGVPIYLQGSASDLEDGNLSGAALSWSSNLDGALGTGGTLLVSLSQGQHTITLTAADSDGNTASAMMTIAVQPVPLLPPTVKPDLVTPVNAVITNQTAFDFAWNSVDHAEWYRIQIANDSAFMTIQTERVTGNPNYETTLTDGVYYWRVRAESQQGNSPWSVTNILTVDTLPPAMPTLISPTDGSTTTNNRPVFTWNTISDAFKYDMRLDTKTPPVMGFEVSNAPRYTPVNPLLATTYHWQVRAVDAAGNTSDWTPAWSLSIESASVAAPVRNYHTATPTLSWTPVNWATGYEVQVSNNAQFTGKLAFSQVIVENVFAVTPDLADGTYFWRVCAKKADGTCGGWSMMDSFVVDVP